jgi:tRNA threonylcarbamoyladenosine biosynthesis protein TsaE
MREPLIHLAHDAATRAFGAALGRALAAAGTQPHVLYFNGELGAGKTTSIGGLLASLGHAGVAKSPTYTLVEPYELQGRSISHIDLYRLAHPREVEALGLAELLQPNAILLIEWAARGHGFVPNADLVIDLEYAAASGRNAHLRAVTSAGQMLADRLRVP